MRLAPYIEAARSADQRVYILFCDLDRFKQVNDTFGHAAGDRLLVTTAARIAQAVPDTAVLARFGGDEFVAVVTLPGDCTSADAVALVLSDRLRTAVAEPVEFEGTEFVVTTTVGVAPFPDDAPVDIDILRNADRALHYAKGAGRDRSQLFVDRADMVHPRVDDAHQLRTAIENGGIVPWYQPIVDAATGRIVGAELLARWIASDGRAVKASEFIDMAHDGGLVERLSEVLTTRALADLAYWKRVGLPPDFRLAVNLPPRFASKDARNDALLALLSSASAVHLVAEISEASVIDDLGVAARRIAALRQLGIEVVLDDFGTGSASLSLLKRVPLDGIKIDRSFVEDIEFDPRDRSLVQNFTQLASELGLTVTGEGVERRSQAEALLELGVARQQGYLYGDAVDAVELVAKLHQPPRRPRATSAA
ncbi:MAG: GGDEF and EAL domain-containing protein [Ilumatobacteraceae bacterium]